MAGEATAANQRQILANQRQILANHRRIEANQATLDRLLKNQKKLDQILGNQKRILSNWADAFRSPCRAALKGLCCGRG